MTTCQLSMTTQLLVFFHSIRLTMICYYMTALFQKSIVMGLLTGTNKGIRSLLEEGLIITREMLREAQLAYPRNTVRNDGLLH